MIAKVFEGIGNPRTRMLLVICVLLPLVMPLSAFSADEDSVATLRQMGKAFASIAEKASPAVVGVRATKVVERDQSTQQYEDEIYRFFYGRPRSPRGRGEQEQRQVAQGSGFIISPDGYILTNNHMVGGAERVSVQLADGSEISAEVKGADAQTDVALIKIDKKDMPYITLANSSQLEVGEWVIAIGSPFGLSHTVTAGIVSAKGRSEIGVAAYEDFIQTDAAINMGNSGGPLLNLDGEAVGINTALIGPGGSVGIGLAIPSNMAKDVYVQLKESGEVVRGFLGVGMADLKPGMGEYFGLKDDKGVVVTSVMPDSAAEKAGVKADDVVVELEGVAVTDWNEFRNRVAMYRPDTKVHLVVMRDGKRKKITATLGRRSESLRAASGRRESVQESLGMSLQTLTKEMASRLGYDDFSGVVVTEVRSGSLAFDAEIRVGTLIMEVNRKPIYNVRDFNEATRKAQDEGKTDVLLRVQDEVVTRLLMLRLSD
jgi:serine protease Do